MQILKNIMNVCLLIFTVIYFMGCEANKPTEIEKTKTENIQQPINTIPIQPFKKMCQTGFIIMGLYDQKDLIPLMGPNSAGWRGIILHYDYTNLSDTEDKWAAANNAGYNPIILDIQREWVANRRDSLWGPELWWGYQHGIHWYDVDDALSGGSIPAGEMYRLAANIHQPIYSAYLIAIEYDINKMEQNQGWHNPVDAIYFYNYWVSSPSVLANYLQRVRSEYPTKPIIPGLGWDPSTPPLQGTDYINAVMPYADDWLISYYVPSTQQQINDLTNYLQNHNYLK